MLFRRSSRWVRERFMEYFTGPDAPELDEWSKIYLNGEPYSLQHSDKDISDDVLETIYNAIKDNEVQ
jgi:hypothetical protein